MTTLTDTQVVTASGGLVELGYSQITSDLSVTGTSTAQTQVISPLTVVCDGSPILVEFFSANIVSPSGQYLNISLWEDGVEKTRYWATSGLSQQQSSAPKYRLTPSAGTHTYAVRAFTTSGTGTVAAGTGSTTGTVPAFLRVSKIVQATQWPAVTTGTIICTSTTRPASPFEGQQIYETDSKRVLIWNGTAWRSLAETDASVGTPLQVVHTTNSTSTQNGGAGSNYAIYAALTTTITTLGASRVLVDGSVGSIQPSTANCMAVVKCDYDNASTDPTVTTNLVAGCSCEWSHNGYDLKNAPFSGLTGVLAAGTYTFRVKVRNTTGVTTQWNWHGLVEQRSWLTLTELAA